MRAVRMALFPPAQKMATTTTRHLLKAYKTTTNTEEEFSQTNGSTAALTSIVAHDEVDVRSEGEGSEVRVTHEVLQGDALHNPRVAHHLEFGNALSSSWHVCLKINHRHEDDER